MTDPIYAHDPLDETDACGDPDSTPTAREGEEREDYTGITCPDCDGDGAVYVGPLGGPHPYHTCPRCEGTGIDI